MAGSDGSTPVTRIAGPAAASRVARYPLLDPTSRTESPGRTPLSATIRSYTRPRRPANMRWFTAAFKRKARSVMPVPSRRSGRASAASDVVMRSMLPDEGGRVVIWRKRLAHAPPGGGPTPSYDPRSSDVPLVIQVRHGNEADGKRHAPRRRRLRPDRLPAGDRDWAHPVDRRRDLQQPTLSPAALSYRAQPGRAQPLLLTRRATPGRASPRTRSPPRWHPSS